MTTEQLSVESPSPRTALALDAIMVAAFAALLVIVAIVAFWLGARRPATPGEASPEVGFARDMAIHHAQAVEMANLLYDRTDNPEMRQLALDILLTQQAQIGQMQGWLTAWGPPLARTEPAMNWMGMPTSGPMPGMASADDLNRLRNLQGPAAEGLFLQLMIPHHRSGVAMAEAVLERAQRPEVRALAQAMRDAQVSEIALMEEMLERRELIPAPGAPPGMDHEDMQR